MFPLEVEGYDPLHPSIQPPGSPPPPSPSPLQLNNTPPLLSLPSPSSASTLQKCEVGKRRLWAGDRRRLDAMKRRRIEERRVVRGRDPVTGGRVVFCEDGKGKGRVKGKVGGGRVGRGRG